MLVVLAGHCLCRVTGISHDEVSAFTSGCDQEIGETWKAFQDEIFLQGQEWLLLPVRHVHFLA
jgi:hypothetical protein